MTAAKDGSARESMRTLLLVVNALTTISGLLYLVYTLGIKEQTMRALVASHNEVLVDVRQLREQDRENRSELKTLAASLERLVGRVESGKGNQ